MAVTTWFRHTNWQGPFTGPVAPDVGLRLRSRRTEPAIAPESNDLGWLSLTETDEVSAIDGGLCQFALVSTGDANSHSPDPFLSDEDWHRLVLDHR
jgi:hypothetical protein